MSSLQHKTLQTYGELLARAPADGWPGKLIVTTDAATGIPAASCIAGATCLVFSLDQAAVRATYRDGGFDFLVNSLDEAIRVLKNEIRQKRPLAVALTADIDAAMAEARERGLIADLAINAPQTLAREHLTLTGEPSPELTSWLAARGWRLEAEDAPPTLAPDDPRTPWHRQLPRYQRSAAREPRLLWI